VTTRQPTRWPLLAALAVACCATVSIVAAPQEQPAALAQPTADTLARVRAALARPASKLTLTDRTPDFTVHVEARRPMQDIFDVPPWATGPVGWQPPGIGFDLLSLVRYVAKGASDAKRGHDLRLAREEMQRSIADYCAALPPEDPHAADASSAADWRARNAQMCSTSPAIR